MAEAPELDFSFIKSKSKIKETSKLEISSTEVPRAQEEFYNMNHQHRGLAIIFNHFQFFDQPKRYGTQKDCKDLEKLFGKLDFDVRVYQDSQISTIKEVLRIVSLLDHSSSDCLVIAVLTHGDKNVLYAQDKLYPTELLWSSFSGDKCPSLAGKPKLLFIQSCRGEATDSGIVLRSTQKDSDDDQFSQKYSIPVMADFLIMYSTVEGFASWRDPKLGSYFVQSLVQLLETHCNDKDLLSILTLVNRKLAIETQIVESNKTCLKQMCCFVSMLTRQVRFY